MRVSLIARCPAQPESRQSAEKSSSTRHAEGPARLLWDSSRWQGVGSLSIDASAAGLDWRMLQRDRKTLTYPFTRDSTTTRNLYHADFLDDKNWGAFHRFFFPLSQNRLISQELFGVRCSSVVSGLPPVQRGLGLLPFGPTFSEGLDSPSRNTR